MIFHDQETGTGGGGGGGGGSRGGSGGGTSVSSPPSTVAVEYQVRSFKDRAGSHPAIPARAYVYMKRLPSGGIYRARMVSAGQSGSGNIELVGGSERPAAVSVSRDNRYAAVWAAGELAADVVSRALGDSAYQFQPSEEDARATRLLVKHWPEYTVNELRDAAQSRHPLLAENRYVYLRRVQPDRGPIYEIRVAGGGHVGAIHAADTGAGGSTRTPTELMVSTDDGYAAFWTSAELRGAELERAIGLADHEVRPSAADQTARRLLIRPYSPAEIEITNGTSDTDGTVLSAAAGATATAHRTVVGKKVHLRVRAKAPAGSTTRPALTSIRWTVPADDTVGAYNPTTSATHPTAVRPLDAANVDLFWIKGGNPKTVTVTAQVDGISKTAEVRFNVLRPTGQLTLSALSSSAICPIGTYRDDATTLAYYNPAGTGTQGLNMDATVQAPEGAGGKIGITQLINTFRRARASSATQTIEEVRWSSDRYHLDDAGGVRLSHNASTREITVRANGSATIDRADHHDSPDEPLTGSGTTGMTAVRVNDRFKVYLVYKPDGDDSIWVTLRKATWQWQGGAALNAARNWVANGTMSGSSTASSDSTELPEWNGTYTALRWGPAPSDAPAL